MSIDWNAFSPATALAGGALIGVSAGLYALVCGRIAGISGMLGALLERRPGSGQGGLFLLGLLLAPLLWRLVAPLPAVSLDASSARLLLAGLLVGLGTRYAGGCTSGHGVCGLARLAPRSLVAVVSFMAAGFVVVWLLGRA